jgi:hypothetical protein
MISFEKALLEGREQEFIYGEVKELCWETVNIKLRKYSPQEKEEAVNFVIDDISDRVSRGYATISFSGAIELLIKKYLHKQHKQLKTVEIDEMRM